MKLPILKLPFNEPILYSAQELTDTCSAEPIAYEWFYIELSAGLDHAVCIFSLRDPFFVTEKRTSAPASLYFTWHCADELKEYAYNLLEGALQEEFCTALNNWMVGKCENLDFFVVGQSRSRICQITLQWPESVPHLSCNTTNQPFPENEKHVWQLLAQGQKISGKFTQHALNRIQRNTLTKMSRRSSIFYDVPLALNLELRPNSSLDFKNANLYFDHNAGTEPLSEIKQDWFWWHWQTETHPVNWEVGYAFPRLNAGYLTTEQDGVKNFKIIQNINLELINDYSISAFGIRHPFSVLIGKNIKRYFSKTIESAPFYCRRALMNSQEIGTLEFLSPDRIIHPLNQHLLNARRIFLTSSQKNICGIILHARFQALCTYLTSTHGKSFYLASHILGKPAQQRAYFIYALCRIIDDATDGLEVKHKNSNLLMGSDGSLQLIDALWNEHFEQEPFPTSVLAFVDICLLQANKFHAKKQIPAFSSTEFLTCARSVVAEMALDRKLFEELAQGQKMDECFTQPASFSELYIYCFKVAGVVGLMMARVLNAANTPASNKAAEHLGIAMQITNILRDIIEDKERNRVYLPSDAEKNLDKEKQIYDLALRGANYYQSALTGLPSIPSLRGRLCVKLMSGIYGAILGKILKNPNISLQKRVIIPTMVRIRIAAQIVFGQSPLKAAGLLKYLKC